MRLILLHFMELLYLSGLNKKGANRTMKVKRSKEYDWRQKIMWE